MFITTILIGRRLLATVASSGIDIWKPPSPTRAKTRRPGLAICAPIAEGSPNPIEPSPPELSHSLGRLNRRNCAPHIWCCPTSAQTIASPPESRSISRTRCCGLISVSDTVGTRGCSAAHDAIFPFHACRSAARRALWEGASSARTAFIFSRTGPRFPTIGRSAARFFPISTGSMSTWMTRAWGAKASSRPVTRSSKRAPSAMIRSVSVNAMFAA